MSLRPQGSARVEPVCEPRNHTISGNTLTSAYIILHTCHGTIVIPFHSKRGWHLELYLKDRFLQLLKESTLLCHYKSYIIQPTLFYYNTLSSPHQYPM